MAQLNSSRGDWNKKWAIHVDDLQCVRCGCVVPNLKAAMESHDKFHELFEGILGKDKAEKELKRIFSDDEV